MKLKQRRYQAVRDNPKGIEPRNLFTTEVDLVHIWGKQHCDIALRVSIS